MECLNCKSKTKIIDKIIAEYHICENCNLKTISYPVNSCCFLQRNEPVKFYKDEIEAMLNSDKYDVFQQCQSCGRKNGTALKKANYIKNDLEYFNNELVEKIRNLRIEILDFSKEIEKEKTEKRRDTFWDDYAEYLKSEEWQVKRKIVLKRDDYLCQSCLCEKAVEVHHKVGIFRKNEPLFSLISVCVKCHNIITDIERGNHKNADKIKHKKELPTPNI